MWLAEVIVNYKIGILDPEAKAIQNALSSMGYEDVEQVVTGKYFQLTFGPKVNKETAENLTKESCDKLLSNPVIQDYSFQLKEVKE